MAFRSARSLADFGRRRVKPTPTTPPEPERLWTPSPGPAWGPVAQLSPRLRMQAASGFRAAAIPLGPGLFLVAEVPEESARAEFGMVPMLAPLMLMAAQRALNPMQTGSGHQAHPWQPGPTAPLPHPQAHAQAPSPWMQALAQTYPAQPSPAAQLGWAHPTDLAQLGCGATSCWRTR